MANFTFPSGSTLKALLEDPNLQVAPVNYNQSKKLKQEKEGGNGNAFDLASAAFLGPSLWDKTYDNADFNLEYMDLDEFLMENGAQTWPDPQTMSPLMPSISGSPPHVSPPHVSPSHVSAPHVSPPHVSPPHVSPPHVSPSVPAMVSPQASPQASPRAPLTPSPAQVTSELAAALMQVPSPEPKPVSPQGWSDREGINLDYAVSDSDLALANAEGEEDFDPRRRQFTEDELKPQPMIKKSKKIFVPSEAKDEKYWARRRKNNVAAKRSRDARRIKENQIAMRAAFLEKENSVLRAELESTRSENYRLKMALKKYEGGS